MYKHLLILTMGAPAERTKGFAKRTRLHDVITHRLCSFIERGLVESLKGILF